VAAASDEWTVVRIGAPAEAADAVANFLFELGVAALIDDTSFEPRAPAADERRQIEAHVPAADVPAIVPSLRAYAAALARLDPRFAPIVVDTASAPPTNWEEVFRAHHRPVAIGERLLVAPPWEVPDAPGRERIVVEPGLAFGTGQHATTRTCLEELEAAVATGRVASVLDVGTGSGVLAAAAARLGVARVVALDIDPAVLPTARGTFERNGLRGVRLVAGPVAAVRGRWDLVLANLLASVLIDEAPLLMARVALGGRLVVSGILAEQEPAVAAAFAGFAVTHVRSDDPWRTLRLERAA
jgi:ribosomal protein L11 methyltransferase